MPEFSKQNPEASIKQAPKKVLIITYYWPPSGGSGVQRWLKFVKYLPSMGWSPVVFTPENPSFEIRDDTLSKDIPPEVEVLRFPIWEPYQIFRHLSKFLGRKEVSQIDFITTEGKSIFKRLSGWIRGNVFIPDPRLFWVGPSVKFLRDFLKANEITTVITTGPPHSLHLIGRKLKKENPSLRWIADFRDPWSEWDLLDTLSLSLWARKRHQSLERKVLQQADRVITIAPFHVSRLETLGGRTVDLITNGFDDDDFRGMQKVRTKKFAIRHIGMVDELRDPRPFMAAVHALALQDAELLNHTIIEFIGSVNSAFREYVASDALLSRVTIFTPPVSHEKLLGLYGETDVQLLVLAHTVLAPGNLPGKFFEYLASGNFIFGVGPEEGDAAKILEQTQAGTMIDRSNESEIIRVLKKRFDQWKVGLSEANRDITAYSRKELTRKLIEVIG